MISCLPDSLDGFRALWKRVSALDRYFKALLNFSARFSVFDELLGDRALKKRTSDLLRKSVEGVPTTMARESSSSGKTFEKVGRRETLSRLQKKPSQEELLRHLHEELLEPPQQAFSSIRSAILRSTGVLTLKNVLSFGSISLRTIVET